MKTKTTSRPLLISLLLGALPLAAACGSAATGGDVGTSAQAAPLVDDGVMPVSSGATPSDSNEGAHRLGHHGFFRRFDKDGDGRIAVADLPERIREHLGTADTDRDGFISRDEMHTARAAMFAKMKTAMDTNHDGTVSDDERATARVKFVEDRLMKHDANGDHALTEDEVSAKKWDHIKKADANGDGRITSKEVAAAASSGVLGHFRGGSGCGDHDAPKNGAGTTLL